MRVCGSVFYTVFFATTALLLVGPQLGRAQDACVAIANGTQCLTCASTSCTVQLDDSRCRCICSTGGGTCGTRQATSAEIAQVPPVSNDDSGTLSPPSSNDDNNSSPPSFNDDDDDDDD